LSNYYRAEKRRDRCSTSDSGEAAVLRPGRNVWRIAHARRFSMLVDAEDYFRTLREALRKARHSIFILAWDIDSRMKLVPPAAHDGYPDALGDFLHAIVSERPALRAYVLNWDFTMLYQMEREWMPVVKLGWRTHKRLAFCMDAAHPAGSCHHQKIVVIDDALAFAGGLDLTRSRWDTPQHRPDEPCRIDPDGKRYEAFHDVQAMVDGDAARALGELCRARWRQATGREAAATDTALCNAAAGDLWPAAVPADVTEVPVGIARTFPDYLSQPACHELLHLHQDIIRQSRNYLYFENQYFTSGVLGAELAERLAQPDGPEVLIVSPRKQSGWLEEATMGVLRSRLHARLCAADGAGRYRLMCPHVPGLTDGCLNVHSKLLVMDGRLLLIGSANLSNRSMACDTECGLCLEASGSPQEQARIRAAIQRMCARLLAEHLGRSVATVLSVIAPCTGHGQFLAAINTLNTGERCLRAFDPTAVPELDALIPRHALFDPERPIAPEALIAELLPADARAPLRRRLWLLMLVAGLLVALALAWRYSPLRDYLNLRELLVIAESLRDLPFTGVLLMLAYVIGSLLMVPVTLMIAATGLVFGVMPGAPYALSGSLLGALAGYGLGKWLGHDAVARLTGPRVNRLSQRIARRGVIAVVVVRLLPLAPFGVINLIAGISHIRLRDYIIGTVLGLLPGVLLTTLFAHHLLMAIRRPGEQTLGVLLIVVLLLGGFALLIRQWLSRRTAQGSE
jgi:phospholipase D1/2